MGNPNTFWKGLLACAVLMAMVSVAFAVTEADVVRLKNKVAQGQLLTEEETHMAMKAEGLFGSRILEPQGLESPRQPNNPLDEYQFSTVPYAWIDITGTGTPAGITGDDQNVGPWNLGFTFTFFNQSYTSVRMCANGWASFTSTTGEYFNGAIPSTATPNNALYPFWDDLYPPSGGQFYYFADAANQRFIMSWINVPHIGSTTELYTFQIVLYTNGDIRYNYLLIPTGGVYGNTTCTVGIENPGGTEALQICFNGAGTLPTSETSILISQPDGVPVAPTGMTVSNTAGGVVVNWVNPTQDTNGNPVTPDHVEVWRGVTGAQILVASLPSGTTTYTHATPSDSTRVYAVRACSPTFCGAYASATVPVPLAPTSVVGTPGANNVVITWVNPTQNNQGGPANVTGAQIWQGQAGTGTLVGTVGQGIQTFNVTGLQSGNYTFSVRALSYVFSGASAGIGVVVGNPSYFSDFEADNGDLITQGGWEWGTPSGVGPASAHSGTNCWGTQIGANYANNACYYLDIDQELTVGSDAATLEFFMWQNCENFWDGMNIKVSTDDGATWEIVQNVSPVYNEDAMNGNTTCHEDEVAWSGNQSAAGWRAMTVQLGAYVGTTPIIRFSFGSDGSVPYPGFYIDDVILWGFGEPEFASVSGTVSLDGGAGTLTSVSVRANGVGNPQTNPAGNGTYTLQNVLTGNRRITGLLAGYHDAVQDIVLTDAGATGVNLTLVRLDPPVPTNLIGSASNETGLVTLDWDDSPDPLVDDYPVYRRLQGEQTWALTGVATSSAYSETLAGPGIYQYAVSARDNGVSTPVESALTGAVNVLYGELPVTSIGASGNYDDRIRLNWLEPGILEGTEIGYDDGTSETWYRVNTPNGPNDYFCVRMSPPNDATYPLMLYAATVFMERSDPLPWVALCPPNASNTGADINNPLYEWTNIGADSTPGWLFAETDGSVFLAEQGDFYIVIQFPPGGTGPGCGSDNSAPDNRSYWTNSYPTWNPWTANDWMMRAWVGGPPPQGLAGGSDSRFELVAIDGRGGYAEDRIPSNAIITPTLDLNSSKKVALAREEYDSGVGFQHPLDQWFPPHSRAPEVMLRREGRRTLDEAISYHIYRDNVQIDTVIFPTTTYFDIGRPENTLYDYHVTVFYDNGQESGPSPVVTVMCNMPPGAPPTLDGTPSGTTDMILTWTAPTTNDDGTPLVDLAGYNVYRSGEFIGTTAPGVMTFTDTPANPAFFYTWTVTAIDEVPNESDPSLGFTAAVVSPWEVVDYEWIDITANGQNLNLTDDSNSGLMPLPWDFEFYGTTYTQFSVCSNGWVSFTSTSPSRFNGAIPNPVEPNAVVYPFWDDLNPSNAGEIYVLNDVNNDRLIVSFVDVPHFSFPADIYTLQVILEPPSAITFQYQLVASAASATIGVENGTGTEAIMLWNNGVSDFGWTPANETAVAFFAPEPTYGPLSGTVTLDGGVGVVTNALVRASGRGTPTTNPDAQGNYSFAQVATGNRTVTGSLAGYNTTVVPVIGHSEGGTTGVNITLVRANPPVPTGLAGSVNSTTGLVTLTWTASTDPLVDVYPVYRRLQGEEDWVLQGTPAASPYTQTLPAAGIYQYAIAARDNGVSTPVESDVSAPVTVLYGALPPTGLSANGNFDDRIVLNWFAPGTPPEIEVSYDSVDVDSTCVEDGLGFNAQFPFGWFAAHYQGNGPITINRVKTRHWPNSTPGCAVQMGVFEDDGTGQPSLTPLGATDWTITNPTAWQDVELTTPVTVNSGSFFVGIRQVTSQRVDIGMDFCAAPQPNTFFYATELTGPWADVGAAGFPQVLCMRAFVVGDMGAGLVALDPTPVHRNSDSNRGNLSASANLISTNNSVTVEDVKGGSAAAKKSSEKDASTTSPMVFAPRPTQGFNGASLRAIQTESRTARDRQPGSLDDILYYIVYRDNVDIGHPTTETYTDLGRTENVFYTYTVLAHYDNNENSVRDTIVARCNMAPAAPTALVANSLGTTQMALAWVAPTTNGDGTPLVDLAGYRILRDGTQIGTTAAGVTTYIDTPPDNQTFYTWTVRAVDEVPNVSNPSNNAIGAIVSPWEVVDYDWVDITGVGTPAGIVNDDHNVGPFPLGFTYTFFGNDYNSVRMCSNGFASFTSTSAAWTNAAIPTASEPNNGLFVFWDDMFPPTGQFMYYQDTANDRFIMSWIGVPHIQNPAALYTFQIIIEESGGIIYNYHTVATATPGATSVSIGVENATGTEGLQLLFNGAGPFTPANQTAVAFWAGPSGSVTGLIREFQTNFPIAGAEITADEAPGELALTDVQGNYTLGLEPGTYTVRVHKQGYCDHVFEDVQVEDGGSTTRSTNLRQPNATFNVTSLNIFTQTGQDAVGSFTIENSAPAQCAVEYSITTNQAWLTVMPATGSVATNSSQVITVNGATAAFPAGDYVAVITVNHNDNGSPQVIPVTVTVALSTDNNVEIPTQFALLASYPNPFNATTALNFDVPNESLVQITIYNVTGQEVARPVNSVVPAGHHRVLYTADNLPTGMYLVKMTAGSFNAIQKMVLLK